jgi:flagellar operon protein
MVKGNSKNFLIPNVTKIPDKNKSSTNTNKLKEGETSEFNELLGERLEKPKALEKLKSLTNDKGIKLSVHAAKRLKERNLEMDGPEYLKLKGAIEKLNSKGGRDSLVITNKAAYIIDVKNNTVVTAFDKENLNENVFTKIDSTILIN